MSVITDNVFSISPNPNFLYQTPALKAVIYQARGTIDRRQGLVSILADVGMGKSTILRYLMADYSSRDNIRAVFIPTPQFTSSFGLIKEISATFGLPFKRSLSAQQDLLFEYLVGQFNDGKNVVLFIDEAQLLKDDLLEAIRGLLNFETNSSKLVQVVLAGQIELKERLNTARNRPLKSRIHSYALLNPLTDKEMHDMIQFRCNLAEIENPFTNQVMEKIWDVTKGVPRDVLKVSDKSLDYMKMTDSNAVSIEMVAAAAEDAGLIGEGNE